MHGPYPFAGRATMAGLERQLHDAAKPSQPEARGPRTWANIFVDDPAAPPKRFTTATNTALPTGTKLHGESHGGKKGRRASCPAVWTHSSQARSTPNQMPRGDNSIGAMRQSLEKQQRFATMLMKDTGKQVLHDLCRHGSHWHVDDFVYRPICLEADFY